MHIPQTPFTPAPPNSAQNRTAHNPAANLPAIIDQLPGDDAHPPQTQFTHARKAAFLKLLADSGEVRVASKAANVSHQTVYRQRRACPTFRLGWDAALLVARERAEEELATRALHGVEEQVFYHGEVVATRRRFDSRLLLAHLARLDRMSEREDIAHLAGAFDAVVEAFEGCAEGAEVVLPEPAPPEEEEPPETSPGPCNTRSMSPPVDLYAGWDDEWDDEDRDDGEDGEEDACEDGDLDWLDTDDPEEVRRRRARMEDARPIFAETPSEIAKRLRGPYALRFAAKISIHQLKAFEAGRANWWKLVPRLRRDGRDEAQGEGADASAAGPDA